MNGTSFSANHDSSEAIRPEAIRAANPGPGTNRNVTDRNSGTVCALTAAVPRAGPGGGPGPGHDS